MIETRILKNPTAEDFSAAGDLIREGKLVAFPTETVYGLGADGFNAKACDKIFAVKERPADNPLIEHVCSLEMVDRVAREIPLAAEKLFAAFSPGPLTLILKKRPEIPSEVTAGLDTVGVRFPDHDFARAFIKAADTPIAAPSANISGRPSPTTAQAVFADLHDKIPMIIDGGDCNFGLESTIVDCTSEIPTILRPGAITREMLVEILGEVQIDSALKDSDAVPKAPGMKYRHYAPRAALKLFNQDSLDEVIFTVKNFNRVGLLASSETLEKIPAKISFNYGSRNDLRSIAANLYEGLRFFDDQEVDLIFAEETVETGLGFAIMNRLRKASSNDF